MTPYATNSQNLKFVYVKLSQSFNKIYYYRFMSRFNNTCTYVFFILVRYKKSPFQLT